MLPQISTDQVTLSVTPTLSPSTPLASWQHVYVYLDKRVGGVLPQIYLDQVAYNRQKILNSNLDSESKHLLASWQNIWPTLRVAAEVLMACSPHNSSDWVT